MEHAEAGPATLFKQGGTIGIGPQRAGTILKSATNARAGKTGKIGTMAKPDFLKIV
ncbi:MAG: hypothetical protein ACKOS8_10500 [Gemmataceae bacterium]